MHRGRTGEPTTKKYPKITGTNTTKAIEFLLNLSPLQKNSPAQIMFLTINASKKSVESKLTIKLNAMI